VHIGDAESVVDLDGGHRLKGRDSKHAVSRVACATVPDHAICVLHMDECAGQAMVEAKCGNVVHGVDDRNIQLFVE
jgi:hypothetical protein